MRRPLFLVLALALAGCGATKRVVVPGTRISSPPGRVLYQGAAWAVSVQGTHATAWRLVGRTWRADRSGEPRLVVLGPKPGKKTEPTPQVAFEAVGKTDLADTAMWVDGVELLGKGGGLTPKRGTIYGAPDAPLLPGKHLAVAYARTATHAAAVAWVFRV